MSKPTNEQIELKVESPIPGDSDSWFMLHMPKNLSGEDNFAVIEWHIEFRRKCMNHGFDNLIELLRKTKETMSKDIAAKEPTP